MPTDQFKTPTEGVETISLGELLGSLSFALDLTEGQPKGHCVRSTWIGYAIGRQMGLDDEALHDLYYAVLLKDLGCSSNAARICDLYMTDDRWFKSEYKTVGDSLPQVLGFVLTHTGLKAGLAERFRAVTNILRNGGQIARELIETRCQRGAEIAASLRFNAAVCDGIRSLDEHWNGSGKPERLAGEAIPLLSRIALASQIAEVFHTLGGREAAIAEVKARSGTWFDPAVVAAFLVVAESDAFWRLLESDDMEMIVFSLPPAGREIAVDEDHLDDIAIAFAQVIDGKSPFTKGHSDRVALYTDMIAEEMGVPMERRRRIKRAALLHDIGKLGVSNSILDKNGKLTDEEFAAVRQHAAHSETILSRIAVFEEMAAIGGAHHERLDGKGYPRRLVADQIGMETRMISVADVFDALTADRPYRAAMPVEKALGIMEADLGKAFDPRCFEALKQALASSGMFGAVEPMALAA